MRAYTGARELTPAADQGHGYELYGAADGTVYVRARVVDTQHSAEIE